MRNKLPSSTLQNKKILIVSQSNVSVDEAILKISDQCPKDMLEKGLNIVGAHIDSPRLDLKPNPLYEEGEFAYFKTHYYGGIKKYQWTAIPLALHGVIVKTNGEKIKLERHLG